MNTKTLFKQIGVAFLFQIGIKLVWVFVIDRGAQNAFGESVYGQYFSYLQLLTILVMIADGGLHNYATLHLNNNLGKNLPKGIGLLKFIYASIYILFAFVILVFVPASLKLLFAMVAIMQLFNSYFLWVRCLLRGHLQNKHDAIVSTLDKFVVVIAAILAWFFYKEYINIFSFVWLQMLGLGFAIFYGRMYIPIFETEAPSLPWRSVVKEASLFGVLLILMTAIYRQDAYLLTHLHPMGSIAAGKYAAAYRLLDAANMLGYVAATYFFSFVALHKNNLNYLRANAEKLTLILVAIAFIGIIIMFFGGNFLGSMLYKRADEETFLLLKFIMFVLPAIFIVHIYGTILSAANQLKSFLVICIIVWILNIALNIIGINTFGIFGSLYAAIISQYIFAACCIYKVNGLK